MDLEGFVASLAEGSAPPDLPPALAGLWREASGDWHAAHETVQDAGDRDSAWVHAYLHRKEGDLANAGYWYRRAGRPPAEGSSEAEWRAIAAALLPQPPG